MDSMMQFWNQIQKSDYYAIVEKLATIDWIAVIMVLWGMLIGARRGVGCMFARVVEVLVVGFVSLTFYSDLSLYIRGLVSAFPEQISDPIAFVLLSACAWVLTSWLLQSLGKFLKIEFSGSFKSLGGLLGGGIFLFLVLSWFSQFLLFFPFPAVQRPFQKDGSYLGETIASTVPAIQGFVAEILKLESKVRARPSKPKEPLNLFGDRTPYGFKRVN